MTGRLVTLTWGAAAGATSYVVEAGSASGLANLAVLPVGANPALTVTAPPGTYFVRVRGLNGCGAGDGLERGDRHGFVTGVSPISCSMAWRAMRVT